MLLSVAATSVSFHGPTHSMPSQHGWHTVAEKEADTVWREKIPGAQMNTLINSKASDTNPWCVSQNVAAWGGGMRTTEKGSRGRLLKYCCVLDLI